MKTRGYWAIGIYHNKTKYNIGTLWRTAGILGASYIFTIGARYEKQSSDTLKTPRHIPLFHFDTINNFYKHLPYDCQLVGIEIDERARWLREFVHPERACYLLGAEDYGLPEKVMKRCHHLIKLEGKFCLNVAVAGSVVAYHRQVLSQ